MMRKAAVLTALCCLLASQASALGLGSLTLESSLNQPLRARIEIVDLGGVSPADIVVQMGSQQDFQRFNLERTNFFSDVDFNVENSAQGVFVVLTSNQSVREPYLSFILDTRWPSGRILSEHTVLLDLPVFSDGRSVAEPINQPVSPVADADTGIESQAGAGARTAASEATVASGSVTSEIDRSPAPESEINQQPGPVARDTAISRNVVSESPSAPGSLEVRDSDTLWQVAMRARPDDSVSIQQTMLAIQRLNPNAFAGGNINRLLSGETLQIPDLSQIQSITQQQAVAEVTRQNQQVDLNVQPLTAPTSGPSSLASADQQGQLRVLTAEDAEPAGAGASAAVEAENAELDARIEALENQLALQEEETDRAELQRAELLARLSDLNEQIASAMEIIRLQDQQLAQLQQSLADAAVQASLQQEQPPVQVEQAVASSVESEPVRTAPPSFVQSIATVLNNNSMILIIVSVLVVLLMVMLLMRRNRVVTAEGIEVEFEGGLMSDDDADSSADFPMDDPAYDEPEVEELEPEELKPEQLEEVAELATAIYADDEKQEVVGEEEPDHTVAEFSVDGVDGSVAEPGQAAETEIELYEPGETYPEEDAEAEPAAEPVVAEQAAEEAVESEASDVVVDFELDTGAEAGDSEENETGVVDFDIDEFLDEEEDIALQPVAEQPEAERHTADAVEAVDFELDTEIGDLEQDVHESESVDAELDDIEFSDVADETIESIDVESEGDGEAESEMDLDPFELEEDPSEERGESAELEGGIESLEFEVGGADVGEMQAETELDIESVSDEEVETLEFELDEEAVDQDLGEDSEQVLESPESVDFELDTESGEESTVTELESVDETAEEQAEIEETEEVEFFADNESELEFDTEAADDTEIGQPEEELEPEQLDEQLAGDNELLEAEMIDVAAQANAEDVEEIEDIEFTDEQDEPAEIDEISAVLLQDEEAATPEMEVELGDLDFLTAETDSTFDDGELESELLPNDDEAATKLDLAYAYQKMGDFDGAKEILEEVMKEGNDAQVSEAKILIETLER
jgi:pilus assembly protein FimV